MFYPLEKYPPNSIKPMPSTVNKIFVGNDSKMGQGPRIRITPNKTIIALPDIRLLLLTILYRVFFQYIYFVLIWGSKYFGVEAVLMNVQVYYSANCTVSMATKTRFPSPHQTS